MVLISLLLYLCQVYTKNTPSLEYLVYNFI